MTSKIIRAAFCEEQAEVADSGAFIALTIKTRDAGKSYIILSPLEAVQLANTLKSFATIVEPQETE